MKNNKNIMSYSIDGQIENWDEGIPLGNGQLGCLLYGSDELRMTVDRIDLWDRREPPETKDEGFNYSNLVKTARENWEEHLRLFDSCYGHSYPTKITVGRLAFPHIIDADSRFSLDMKTAEAVVMTKCGEFRVFMDARELVGVAKIPKSAAFEIQTPAYISAPDGECEELRPTEKNEGGDFEYCLKGLSYPPVKKLQNGNFTYTLQETKENFVYGIIVLRKPAEQCDELFFDIWQDKDGFSLEEEMAKLSAYAKRGYSALFREHKKYWQSYYAVSNVTSGDFEFDSYYIKSKYLFASTSREGGIPMSLQGVWTADNGKLPPWKADFHGDVNLQVSYEAFMKAGNFPEGKVLADYLFDNMDAFRKFTKSFFGFEGCLLPGIFSIDGKPLGGWPQYALNPVCGMWLAKCFDEYYLYSGDEKFFRERAYPFITEMADSAEKILIKDCEGYLALPLTSSPEFYEGEREAYLPSQSNFELSILKNLFTIAEKYAVKRGKSRKAQKYTAVLEKLKPYEVNPDGSLRICREQDFDMSHRHFSHMLAICPFHLFDAERDRKMILANIEKLEYYGTVNWVGFSFVCMAELCAYIGEGNRAYRYMRDYMDGYTVENGFHLNGDFKNYGYGLLHYRPFTLEAVMEFAKAYQDMVLACDDDVIIPFPAIPDKWRKNKISFKNLRAHGGVKLSAATECGKVTEFTISVPRKMTVKIKNVFGKDSLGFAGAGTDFCITAEQGGIFEITLEKGKYKLDM